jgi:hypothetical protein
MENKDNMLSRNNTIRTLKLAAVQMESQDSATVSDITLDPARKKFGTPHAYGRYIYPGLPGRVLLGVVEVVGRLWYTFSQERWASAQRTAS